ncbi:MAG: carbohydrate ABC transporter permease [Anaerolineae bacterium]
MRLKLGACAAPGLQRLSSSSSRKWRAIWKNRVLYLLLLPIFAGAALFQYYPTAIAFYRSVFAWDGRKAYYIGLGNFAFFLSDPALVQSWVNVAKLLVFGIAVTVTVPVWTSYLIYRLRSERQRYLYRVLLILPIVVPGFVSILLWRWFYSYNGAINVVLRGIGLGDLARLWLGDPATALYAIMFIGFPWSGGISMLIYLAGFMAIPSELVDAAVVDGAVGLRRLWSVEIPLIMGQIKLLVILTFIGTIQGFQTQLIMTKGGPGYATMVPGLRLYQAAIEDRKLGYSSAIGLVLFVVIFALTLLNQRYISAGQEFDR